MSTYPQQKVEQAGTVQRKKKKRHVQMESSYRRSKSPSEDVAFEKPAGIGKRTITLVSRASRLKKKMVKEAEVNLSKKGFGTKST